MKVSADLPRHTKLYKLARQLKIKRREALAYLVQLWSFVLQYYPDGEIFASPDEIAFGVELDEAIEPETFVQALCDCALPKEGFLKKVEEGHYTVHDWLEFSGNLEYTKAKNREKLRAWREKKKALAESQKQEKEVMSASSNDDVTVTEQFGNEKVTSREGEEEGEEEKEIHNRYGNECKSDIKFVDPWVKRQVDVISGAVKNCKTDNLDAVVSKWRDQYGAAMVEQTIPKALLWMQEHGKRYTDMGRFIGNWLRNERQAPAKATRATVDYGDELPEWEDLRRRT